MVQMTDIWFTSDLHIGHENINKYCYRPFATSQEMDEYMLERWNSCVKPGDTIYVLGDMHHGKGSGKVADLWLSRANGRKHIVWGNHDHRDGIRGRFVSAKDYAVLRKNETSAPWDMVLFHFPIESWERRNKGAVHLHGHTHNQSRKIARRIDVGVDAWDYRPVHLDQIVGRVQNENIDAEEWVKGAP